LAFGKYKGAGLGDVSIDYLGSLLKADWLWPATRAAIRAYLVHQWRNASEVPMPFGKHEGECLADVDARYLDWLVGEGFFDDSPVFGHLVMRAIRNRCFRVRVTCDPVGGKTCGYVLVLPEIDEYEPFATRGFTPSERLTGAPRKPGVATMARPKACQSAEDDAINQEMGLPPMAVLHERRERNKTYWAWTEDEGPVIRGGEEATDGDRLRAWDRALESLSRVEAAQDLDDLGLRAGEAEVLIRLLAQSEGWDESGNQLLDELHTAFRRRELALLRREECCTDADQRVVAEGEEEAPARGKRHKGGRNYADENVLTARVHEVVRHMRGCRTEDELLDVAFWVKRHADEFDDEHLAALRKWYSYFLAQLTVAAE
jgi:uncharacterized protein (DUF3820 family)